MAYKTILTVLSDPRQLPQLEAASALTVREDGHLDILCLGIDHTQAGYYFPDGTAYAFQESINAAMSGAEELEQAVRDHLAGAADLRWSVEWQWRRSVACPIWSESGRGFPILRCWPVPMATTPPTMPRP